MSLHSKMEVLIVGGEETAAFALSEMLSKGGFHVFERVDSAETALNSVHKVKPDVILMDIKPGNDSAKIQVAERLKREFDIPTVFISTVTEDELFQKVKSAEPYGYLISPFDERELILCLEMAIFRHDAEKEIRRLNRLYHFISEVNQAIVRVKNENELFSKVCDISINHGGYKLAWIGLIENSTKRVLLVAFSGDAEGYLEKLNIGLDDEIYGFGLTATAIKTRKPYISHDYLHDERLKHWWELASKKGFRAAAALPLFIKDEVCGALMLYSDDKTCFNESEIKLLEEVASDISFALTSLKESRMLERIFSLTPDILILIRKDTTIKDVNPSWEHILGWPWNETVNRQLLDFVANNSIEHFSNILKKLSKGVSVPVSDFGFKTKYGTTRILSWNFLPAIEEEFIFGVARDITDKVLAQNRIHEINAIYTSLVENLRQAVFQKDAFGRYLFANARFCEMTGLPLNEIIGKTDAELFIQPIAEKYQKGDDRVIKFGETIEYTAQLSTHDRKETYIRITKTPVKNIQGEIEKIQGIIQDITHDVETAKLLNLQSVALESAGVAILIIDVNKKILKANKAMEKLSGYSIDELIGKDVSIINSDVHGKEFYEQIWKTVFDGRNWTGEVINKRKAGNLYTVELTITPIKGDTGKIDYFVLIANDISFKKELEMQIHRIYRLESVATLVAALAHDINNAIAPITMAVSLLRSEHTSPEAERLYDTILSGVARSSELLRDVLSATLGTKMLMQPLNMAHLIKNTFELVKPLLNQDIQLELRLADNLRKIHGNATRLQQALRNLIINAQEAMPNGGKITISAMNFDPDEEFLIKHINAKPIKYIKIEVSDTGIGIHPDNLEKIFDPFFTTKQFGRGHGLGLSITQSIINKHDGIIDVESVINKGTTFTIYLPAIIE